MIKKIKALVLQKCRFKKARGQYAIFDEQCEILNLSKSYRTTREITETSNLILKQLNLQGANPVIRDGESVSFIDVSPEERGNFYVSKIAEFCDKGYKSVGIICKNETEMENVSKDFEKNGIPFHFIRKSDCEYDVWVSLLTPYLAKSLEFDGNLCKAFNVPLKNCKNDNKVKIKV